jgi:hypothetical protein
VAPSAAYRCASESPRIPLSATATTPGMSAGDQAGEGIGIDVEGLEVAGVDPEHVRANGERALDLGLVVDLDQGGHAEFAGEVVEAAQLPIGQRGDDEQHEIGAVGAGLVRTGIRSTMKSLRRTGMSTAARTASRSARLPPKRRCSVRTEMAAAPPVRIGRGQRGRVGDVREGALARAGTLDLGDHAETGAPQSLKDGAGGRGVAGRRGDLGKGGTRHTLGEVGSNALDEGVQHGRGRGGFGHEWKAIPRSRQG